MYCKDIELTSKDRDYIELSAMKLKKFCQEYPICNHCPFDNGGTCEVNEPYKFFEN